MRRVVVTGMSGLCPMGLDWPEVEKNLRAGRNCVRYIPEWEVFDGLRSRLGAPLPPLDLPPQYTRKRSRSMGRVALLATRSSEIAIEDAGLLNDPVLKSGQTGIAYGSSSGSPWALCDMARMILEHSTASIQANTYIQMMPHTTAANISVFFGIRGRLIPTSTACTSGSLAIGLAYEAIRHGKQTVMIAGCQSALNIDPLSASNFDPFV